MTDPRSQWSVEQVAALAPSPAQFAAADELGEPSRWHGCGSADGALWGRYVGSRSEPYDTAVDVDAAQRHDGLPRFQCSCPSRKRPCKHGLGLLLLWLRNHVPDVAEAAVPTAVRGWIDLQRSTSTEPPTGRDPVDREGMTADGADGVPPAPAPPPAPESGGERDDRLARMNAGLTELSRWLEDRVRTGLADPSLARYSTWDDLAARLVDAQVGALANRVRRLAGLVGATPGWHETLLAELGVLHLLARAGRRLTALPPGLGDGVATAVGWQVRHASVLAGVPETDVWHVLGRSDRREDRIEVRRTWLRAERSGRWAMLLSFAAYRQSLDTSFPVGVSIDADVHRFPGAGMRALVGLRHGEMLPAAVPAGLTVTEATAHVGRAVLAEPWTEHIAVTITAALTNHRGRWVLTDADGSLPCDAADQAYAAVLAATAGRPVPITVEWTPSGLVPLTIHLPDRHLDVGPLADPSFVSAA
jgi:hypothetical protein